MNKISFRKASFFYAGNPLKPKSSHTDFGYIFNDFIVIKGTHSFGKNFYSKTSWSLYRGKYRYEDRNEFICVKETLNEIREEIKKILKNNPCQAESQSYHK